MVRTIGAVLILMSPTFMTPMEASAKDMPKGFVHLRAVDPTILQDIRYATPQNFVGKRLPGYDVAECVLFGKAANALKKVQAELRDEGLALKVFDCYRPARAVSEMVRWAKRSANRETRARYHPRIAKSKLFPRYIATRSGHSKGTAVDLTIVDLAKRRAMGADTKLQTCRNGKDFSEKSAEMDMGTAFDCFDPMSQTRASGLGQLHRNNRDFLVTVMKRHGFKNYAGEWWHFTYVREASPKSYFDFAIPALGETDKSN